MTKKTLLIGSFGAHNIGDELILNAALEHYAPRNCIVMTADPQHSQSFCEKTFLTTPPIPTGFRSFLHPIKAYKELKKIEPEIEKICFAGGGLWAHNFRAIWIWTFHFFVFKNILKKPIILTYQGIDKPRNFIWKSMLKYCIKNAQEISVRDTKSQQYLQDLKTGKSIKKTLDRVEEWLITNNIQKKYKKETKTQILYNASRSIKAKIKDPGIFVEMEKKDKKQINHFPKNTICNTPKNITETLNQFGKAKLAIGHRFHFLILAKHFISEKNNVQIWPEFYAEKTQNLNLPIWTERHTK